MYCRKCIKENKNKKITMENKIEEKCYICPMCKNIVRWGLEENLEEIK